MNIRIATFSDISAIKTLYRVLFTDMSKLQPKYFKEGDQDTAFLQSILEDNEADIIIAEKENQVIGFALLQAKVTPEYECLVFHKYAYLMDLVVAPKQRGGGTGTKLMNACKDWARSRNLEYLELNVLRENEAAIKLYEREKFREDVKTMKCEL